MSRGISPETLAYRSELLADVLDHASQEGNEAFIEEAFTDLLLEDLEHEGRWPDYQLAHLDRRGARVDAWGLDTPQRTLYLAISDFDATSEQVTTIPASEVKRQFRRLQGFLEKASRGSIEVGDHDPVADLLDVIEDEEFDRTILYLLTERVAADVSIDSSVENGIEVVRRIWDIEQTRRARQSGVELDPIEINFLEEFGAGLPYLDGGSASGVQTYLSFVPAQVLASVYNEHGGRLLERNVRAFLSARGKVNQGIRDTLRSEPERFLAYNNGLTATASSISETSDQTGDRVIASAADLQIVNGGQTTASIAAAARDPKVDLQNVLIQMKLAVIDEHLLDEMVPNISRYANRQNAVQESDLSSNHEYLTRLQDVSRRLWTPVSASGRPTKWYFERARGSYGVDQNASGSTSAQARFKNECPKSQKFGKNELAVYENTWSKLPHLVARGGQKNFVEFMLRLPEPPATGPKVDLDGWYQERFKELVAKAITFKTADAAVRRTYGGTYKRAVVTYTLAYILTELTDQPSLDGIWIRQSISDNFTEAIVDVAGPLKDALIDTGHGRNIGEWAKKEECWKTLSSMSFDFSHFGESGIAKPTTVQPALTGTAQRLADAIEKAQGEAIEGRYKRYRKRRWFHIGDTGIPASGRGTLHVYSGSFSKGAVEYVFSVVVDFAARTITPLEDLDKARRGLVEQWFEDSGVADNA